MPTSLPDHKLAPYLNGQWIDRRNELSVLNPSTGEPIASVGTVSRADVAAALSSASDAWPAWRAQTGRQRGEFLLAIAQRLSQRAEEVCRAITLENGKPLAQSRGEFAVAIDHLRWYAAESERAYGRIAPPQVPNKRHLVLRTPVGVVGAIAPWNFPLVLAVRKLAPALAAGCPVVLKPASATPLSCCLLADVINEVGLPPGVFQCVHGRANEIGNELLENPLCRKITFTGSTEVGKLLVARAAQTMTRLSLELGGQAPLLVFDDADLESAVEGACIAKFRNTGQSCIAANRIYVQRSIADRFLPAFVSRVEQLKIGDGLEPDVEIGPLIDDGTANHALHHIEDATDRGARLLCGGRRLTDRPGYFLEPTVLADVPDEALCLTQETFAPVVPISLFDEESEAIARANDTRYGLAAYAFTRDISRVWRLAEQLEAGTIGINETVPATSQCPFGGFKESGWGRELGIEGMDAFLETKHVSLGVEP